jgi:hypothetical protein
MILYEWSDRHISDAMARSLQLGDRFQAGGVWHTVRALRGCYVWTMPDGANELRAFSIAALTEEHSRDQQVRRFRRVRFKHSFRETSQRLQRSRLLAGTPVSAPTRPRERRSAARRNIRKTTSGTSRDGPGSSDDDEPDEHLVRPHLDGAMRRLLREEVDRRLRERLEIGDHDQAARDRALFDGDPGRARA